MADRNPFARADFLPRPKQYVKPVLVGGSLASAWVIIPLSLAAFATFITVIGTVNNSLLWLAYGLPIAGCLAAPGIVSALVQLVRQRWIEVTDDGFNLILRDGSRRSYNDTQITSVSQATTIQNDGSHWRWVRIEVQSDQGNEVVPCHYHVPGGQPDPLFVLVDRVVRGMATRVTAGLEQGARLEGTGWHYDRHGLHVHHGPNRGVYTADELTFVGFFDMHLCVWRGMKRESILRVHETTPNAHALGQVVWALVEKLPNLAEPQPGDPLGKLLSVKRGHDAGLGWVVLGVSALLSLVFIPISSSRAPLAAYLMFGSFVGLLASLGLWLVLRGSYMRLAFHQWGVVQPGRGRQVLYSEIDRMTWSNGFILLGPKNKEQLPIRFSSVGLTQDADVLGVRDQAALAVALRWWEELGRGPVRWTKRIRFMPGGLEYRPAGIFGDAEAVTAAYHLTSYYMLGTHLEIFVTGVPKAVVNQPLTEVNFYPGLKLLDLIYASMRQQYEEQQKAGRTGDPRPNFSLKHGESDARIRSADGPERKVTPDER